MWPEPVERVARELRAAAAEATIQEFPEGTPTAEAAAQAIGCRARPRSSSRSCSSATAPYVLALVPGDRRADAGAGRRRGRGREGAGRDARRRCVEATGFEPGARGAVPARGRSTRC